MEFELNKRGSKETLAIFIINIGHVIDPLNPRHKHLCNEIGLEATKKEIGAYEDFYELTCDGEPLNLNEIGMDIVDTRE